MTHWFDIALVRFGLSGTLIALYGVADALARRAGPTRSHESAAPGWVQVVIFASITLYYFLIRPFGGALLGGYGNVLGIVLVGVAMAVRWRSRHGARHVRYPAMAARMLLYVALPLAVGMPLGWLALTLPACGLSAWLALREDRRRQGAGELSPSSARWIPGVW